MMKVPPFVICFLKLLKIAPIFIYKFNAVRRATENVIMVPVYWKKEGKQREPHHLRYKKP